MKIWFQSCGNIGVDPAWKGYEQALEKHLKGVARPDTKISLHGVKVWSPGVNDYRYHASLNVAQEIEHALQAEREGYDAFAQTGTLDLGYFEIKEVVRIPVVFTTEIALHVATILAPKAAFLVMSRPFLNFLNERAKIYGFQEKLTAGESVLITVPELQAAFKKPDAVIERLSKGAKKIAEQGANVIICAGNPITMLLAKNGITELGGVRVLDSLAVLVKVTELLVDLNKLGINRDGMGLFAPLPKEEIKKVRKIFGVER